MDPILLGMLVVVPLVQVPLVLWFGRYFEVDEDYDPPTDGFEAPNREKAIPTGDDADRPARRARPVAAEAGRCWQCGTLNDPAFSYCRDCLTALG